ncbi:unnamed protein product [Gongylonema pulchrum]|uniref:Uncharacterized protein n=1 Tax=Gongylonema pulchrum TaxID=637853 RepID=A0A183D619_9BILA|nr:unnamed protein product [Gongylonema pulchrum]
MHEIEERKSTPPPPYSPERPPPPYSKTKLENAAKNDNKNEEIKGANRQLPAPPLPCTPFSSGSVTATVYPRPASPPTTVVSTSEGINPASSGYSSYAHSLSRP